jgi:hypothetical protein
MGHYSKTDSTRKKFTLSTIFLVEHSQVDLHRLNFLDETLEGFGLDVQGFVEAFEGAAHVFTSHSVVLRLLRVFGPRDVERASHAAEERPGRDKNSEAEGDAFPELFTTTAAWRRGDGHGG